MKKYCWYIIPGKHMGRISQVKLFCLFYSKYLYSWKGFNVRFKYKKKSSFKAFLVAKPQQRRRNNTMIYDVHFILGFQYLLKMPFQNMKYWEFRFSNEALNLNSICQIIQSFENYSIKFSKVSWMFALLKYWTLNKNLKL